VRNAYGNQKPAESGERIGDSRTKAVGIRLATKHATPGLHKVTICPRTELRRKTAEHTLSANVTLNVGRYVR
jgi:hypothetical protein